jgi:hypothetical protein
LSVERTTPSENAWGELDKNPKGLRQFDPAMVGLDISWLSHHIFNRHGSHLPFDECSGFAPLTLIGQPRGNDAHCGSAPNFKYRKLVVPKPKNKESPDDKTLTASQQASRMTWAQRLGRVFNIDIETCPECAGKVKVISSIEDPRVIKKILDHLGLDSRAPTPWNPRGPPDTPKNHDPFTQNFPVDEF